MHWHAIRRSSSYPASENAPWDFTETQQHDTDSGHGNVQTAETALHLPQGQDDACDAKSSSQLSFMDTTTELLESFQTTNTDDNDPTENEDQFFQVSIPTFTTGLTLFAYERALRNRVRSSKLKHGGEYDMHTYTPTFVHDCLMLPGALINVLDKGSPEDIKDRITPALLPGFQAQVHPETQEPCLLQSTESMDYVQGMIIFGEGRNNRDLIHAHYRPNARRVKVQVEVDVVDKVPLEDREFPTERWRLRRKTIWAHAWLWSDLSVVETALDVSCWKLEDYLSGHLSAQLSLRISRSGNGDEAEDGELDVDVNDRGHGNSAEREVVYARHGTLDYERVRHGFAGW